MFFEISCNRKISPPGLKRYPQNYRPYSVFQSNPYRLKTRILLGTHSLRQGQDTWQGIALRWKNAMGLLLGLGILRQVSILTLALFISFLNHMFKKKKTPFCLLTHVAFPQCKKRKKKKESSSLLRNSDSKKPGGTDEWRLWHPALAVTKCQKWQSWREHATWEQADSTEPLKSQEHGGTLLMTDCLVW